jgi:hypothetical protein
MRRLMICLLLAGAGCATQETADMGVTHDTPPPADAQQPVFGCTAFNTRARQTWDARRTGEKYPRPADTQGPRLYLEETSAVPGFAKPGGTMQVLAQYAVLDAPPGFEVTEVRRLLREGQAVAELSSVTGERTNGTWICTQELMLPVTMPRGDYAIEQVFTWEGQEVRAISGFSVGSR